MDQNYAKENLEYYKKTLENSVKMYDMTIEEMTARSASPESLSFVIQMKRDTEEQIKEINASLESLNNNKKADFVIAYNKLIEKMMSFNPYARNRFLVDFETDVIKDFYVESASYSDDRLSVRFRNSEAFFAPEYFEQNKQFENARIFLLSPICEKKAMITFYGLEVECFQTDCFNYGDDGVLCTEVVFKFKKVIHSNHVNEIGKDPK